MTGHVVFVPRRFTIVTVAQQPMDLQLKLGQSPWRYPYFYAKTSDKESSNDVYAETIRWCTAVEASMERKPSKCRGSRSTISALSAMDADDDHNDETSSFASSADLKSMVRSNSFSSSVDLVSLGGDVDTWAEEHGITIHFDVDMMYQELADDRWRDTGQTYAEILKLGQVYHHLDEESLSPLDDLEEDDDGLAIEVATLNKVAWKLRDEICHSKME